MAVNPLANPKGSKLVCHLCEKPAYLQCTHCRVTYYCGPEHQEADWESIHEQVCDLIGVLRSPLSHAHSEAERKHRLYQQQLRKEHIISIALTESRRHLYSGEHAKAFAPSLLALKLLTEIHGPAHLDLTPALLVLAQSAIGLKQIREAEQYLSQAQWAVLKAPDCSPALQSQLYRNLGLLELARGHYKEARKHLAEDIYQSSVAHGPTAIQTAGGLYHLGTVFLKEGKPVVALSFMDRVVSIWMSHLEGIADEIEKVVKKKPSFVRLPGSVRPLDSAPTLSVSEQVEALHDLTGIEELKDIHSFSPSTTITLQVCYTLALLQCVIRNYAQAEAYSQKAAKLVSSTPSRPFEANISKLSSLISLLKDIAEQENSQQT